MTRDDLCRIGEVDVVDVLELPPGQLRGKRLGVHEPLVRFDVDLRVQGLEFGDIGVEDLPFEGLRLRWLAGDRDLGLAPSGVLIGGAVTTGGDGYGDARHGYQTENSAGTKALHLTLFSRSRRLSRDGCHPKVSDQKPARHRRKVASYEQ